MLVPPTPPPTITTRARSRIAATLRSVGEPPLVGGVGDQPARAAEALARLRLEIGVQRRDRPLHRRPHPLAQLAHDLHQLQAGAMAWRRRRAEVALQQVLVVVAVERGVDAEVAEVEPPVVVAGVLE